MSIKAYIHKEIVKGENRYTFSMPLSAPVGEAYDAAFECLDFLVKESQKVAEKAKPKTASPEVVEKPT